MINSIKKLREQYFKEIAKTINPINAQFVIVTHILSDRPELLSAIEMLAPIALVISIPYSEDKHTLSQLSNKYKILTLTLEEMNCADYLYEQVLIDIDISIPLIILEIGGYFAPFIDRLQRKLGNKLLGVVEDTETGHRQYQQLSSLVCPIVSVARSTLKETEDFLVGNSCLFSTERLIRDSGFLIDGKQALILGFGKVGRGLAHALLRRVCHVYVYDINPIRRILALSEGFQIPERDVALQKSDLIFGATGNYSLKNSDFKNIKKGALLVSCSSKKNEFNLEYLEKKYKKKKYLKNYTKYSCQENYFYLLAEGLPINFLDGAVIGPILALVQSEIIIGIKEILALAGSHGIYEIKMLDKIELAKRWLNHFIDPISGGYLNDSILSD
jgi:adenosylhomocysteinase